MFLDWLFASFHHLAVFSLAAILSAEIFLTAGAIDDRMALRLARVDASFRPPAREIARLRRALYAEAGLFALIPLCAAAMARGYGM
jgi:uncharacterized membrane protein